MELWRELTVEPTGDKTHGPCDCCGQLTRRVWGFVHRTSGRTVASYFVSWMEKNSAHDVYVDLIIGRWGDGTSAGDRRAVSLAYRPSEGGFMVVDAATRAVASSSLVGGALASAQVVDHPIAIIAYAVVDAIWLNDARIEEIRAWSPPRAGA